MKQTITKSSAVKGHAGPGRLAGSGSGPSSAIFSFAFLCFIFASFAALFGGRSGNQAEPPPHLRTGARRRAR